ncbi:hypothetical protein V6N12_016161 [Hibiscus sabdariffa]|uniref:Uncharacterized protein n=1 Tax=Hibiscus sabdariffa TaxID=183260 RepID=A0ABR2C8X5_9ROSI
MVIGEGGGDVERSRQLGFHFESLCLLVSENEKKKKSPSFASNPSGLKDSDPARVGDPPPMVVMARRWVAVIAGEKAAWTVAYWVW